MRVERESSEQDALVGSRELLRDGGDIFVFVDFDDTIHFGGVAHQLYCAGVHHPLRRVAVHGEPVEQDVRDGETAIFLYGRSLRQDCLGGLYLKAHLPRSEGS